jgi:hypothetical protein
MHELLHFIGFCPDSLSHFNLLNLTVANEQIFSYLNINTIKYYVIKFRSSRKVFTNKQ